MDATSLHSPERARLAIGVVTGANELFVVSEDVARQHQLPEMALTPILAKLDISPGLSVRRSDFRIARKKGLRCLLVDASTDKRPRELIQYFYEGSAQNQSKERDVWQAPRLAGAGQRKNPERVLRLYAPQRPPDSVEQLRR